MDTEKNGADHASAEHSSLAETTTTEAVTVRRAPKFAAFIIGGGVLGLVVACILTPLLQDSTGTFSIWSTLGYLAVIGAVAGVALGSIAAVVIDQLSVRQAKQASASHTTYKTSEDPKSALGSGETEQESA